MKVKCLAHCTNAINCTACSALWFVGASGFDPHKMNSKPHDNIEVVVYCALTIVIKRANETIATFVGTE